MQPVSTWGDKFLNFDAIYNGMSRMMYMGFFFSAYIAWKREQNFPDILILPLFTDKMQTIALLYRNC